MYLLFTVGMSQTQASNLAKKMGFSEECIDEVSQSVLSRYNNNHGLFALLTELTDLASIN